jgi:hypothetical protein
MLKVFFLHPANMEVSYLLGVAPNHPVVMDDHDLGYETYYDLGIFNELRKPHILMISGVEH